MREAVPSGQWAALRALREGQPPTLPRLAAAAGISLSSLKSRASRGGWKAAGSDAGKADAQIDRNTGAAGGRDAGGTTSAEAEGTAEARLARASDMLLREIEAIGALAQASGRMPDKARIDAVGAMIRLLEKVEEFALARRNENGRNENGASRDGEIADVLGRIDARIEDLARAYAKELGKGEPVGTGSGADP